MLSDAVGRDAVSAYASEVERCSRAASASSRWLHKLRIRRRLLAVVLVLAGVIYSSLFLKHGHVGPAIVSAPTWYPVEDRPSPPLAPEAPSKPQLEVEPLSSWPSAHLALEAGQQPGPRFRDSLRSDRRYLTGFAGAGFNNQLIGSLNILHIAYTVQNLGLYSLPHVVVLPPITPHLGHLEADSWVDPITLNDVFDLHAFEAATGIATISWEHIKNVGSSSAEIEDIGCWSPSWTQFGSRDTDDVQDNWLGVRRRLTPIPANALSGMNAGPEHYLIPIVASMLSPPVSKARGEFLSGWSGESAALLQRWGLSGDWRSLWGDKVAGWLEPEGAKSGQLACFDGTYFGSDRGEEVREMYLSEAHYARPPYGAWTAVGQHLHWNATLEAQAKETLRTVLGLKADTPLPRRFSTMHIRRSDFVKDCDNPGTCGAVSVYARHLLALQENMVSRGYKNAKEWPVIVTTDESDPAFLAELTALGWRVVDHLAMRTKARFGHWGPTLIDTVILSLGKAFVGTDGSTMSILALRRVQDWNEGSGSLVNKYEMP